MLGGDLLACSSYHHVGPDMEIELFRLQPEPDETVTADRTPEPPW